ncbi:MAG: hypothetical protein R3264_06870 [Anaerolineae bacterium]|nr:hypothetical protein [Anaerolineae bacterium]
MKTRHILLTALLSTGLTVLVLGGTLLFFSRAVAAPLGQVVTRSETRAYVSVSALAFMPTNRAAQYSKNSGRQMLTLDTTSRIFDEGNSLYIAPLTLPDQSVLTGMTVFGEDFDNQGAVTVSLKRCDHSQARCVSLTDATSTIPYALGAFETVKVAILNEVVNNNLHTYFLELELTALNSSGLRSVRIEMLTTGGSPPPVTEAERWELSGNLTNFVIPNSGYNQVQVCTDDLSSLPNPTHYPILRADGRSFYLDSSDCVTVWGTTIQIQRRLNTAASSGTYRILR